jgi:hypothetical protein
MKRWGGYRFLKGSLFSGVYNIVIRNITQTSYSTTDDTSSVALAALPVCRESESMGLVKRVAVNIRFFFTHDI